MLLLVLCSNSVWYCTSTGVLVPVPAAAIPIQYLFVVVGRLRQLSFVRARPSDGRELWTCVYIICDNIMLQYILYGTIPAVEGTSIVISLYIWYCTYYVWYHTIHTYIHTVQTIYIQDHNCPVRMYVGNVATWRHPKWPRPRHDCFRVRTIVGGSLKFPYATSETPKAGRGINQSPYCMAWLGPARIFVSGLTGPTHVKICNHIYVLVPSQTFQVIDKTPQDNSQSG